MTTYTQLPEKDIDLSSLSLCLADYVDSIANFDPTDPEALKNVTLLQDAVLALTLEAFYGEDVIFKLAEDSTKHMETALYEMGDEMFKLVEDSPKHTEIALSEMGDEI